MDGLGCSLYCFDALVGALGAAGTHESQDTDVEDDRATTSTFRGCDRRGADGTWALRGSAWVGRMADVISQSLSRNLQIRFWVTAAAGSFAQ